MNTVKGNKTALNIMNRNGLRRYVAAAAIALLAVPVAVGTTGCGGGGGGGATKTAVTDTTGGVTAESAGGNRGDNAGQIPAQPAGPFSPNFHNELEVGRVWDKRQLLVYVDTASATTPAAFDRAEAVRLGLSLWGAQTNHLFGVAFTDDPAVADVVYKFIPAGSLNAGEIGRAQITYRNSDEVIVKAMVRVDETLDHELMAQVSAHEFGHALGMSGHSAEPKDLMFSHSHMPAEVTVRDANTLLYNYSEFNTNRQREDAATESGVSRAQNNGGATRTVNMECGMAR